MQRDEEDMVEFVKNCPVEFKEYYIQMQAAKRSQAPLPSQVNMSLCHLILLPRYSVFMLRFQFMPSVQVPLEIGA